MYRYNNVLGNLLETRLCLSCLPRVMRTAPLTVRDNTPAEDKVLGHTRVDVYNVIHTIWLSSRTVDHSAIQIILVASFMSACLACR